MKIYLHKVTEAYKQLFFTDGETVKVYDCQSYYEGIDMYNEHTIIRLIFHFDEEAQNLHMKQFSEICTSFEWDYEDIEDEIRFESVLVYDSDLYDSNIYDSDTYDNIQERNLIFYGGKAVN